MSQVGTTQSWYQCHRWAPLRVGTSVPGGHHSELVHVKVQICVQTVVHLLAGVVHAVHHECRDDGCSLSADQWHNSTTYAVQQATPDIAETQKKCH